MDPHTPKLAAVPLGIAPLPTSANPSGAFPFLSAPERSDEIGRLGPYRVLAELGRGGMGVVFLAEETDLKRRVALKVMLPDVAADPRAVARFRREAEAQAKVEHDHIIAIYRVGYENGVPFLAMPLLKGQTLAAVLKQNPRPPLAELVRIGREIAEGLAAAHAEGLVHRDIKPGNVWLEDARRRVKILDFGLARGSTDAPGVEFGSVPALLGAELTAAGAVMGTPAYMSPEQALSRPVDHRCDLFSLGVVLYQMATGRMPFTGATAFEVMAAAVEFDPPSAHELVPDVPVGLSDLIRRLMAKNPTERPPSAETVATELEALERGSVVLPVRVIPLGPVPAESDPWTDLGSTEVENRGSTNARAAVAPPARVRRFYRLWPAGASLAAVALVWAVFVRPDRSPQPNSDGTGQSLSAAPPAPEAARPAPNLPQAPPPTPVVGSQREATVALIPYADLTVRTDDGRTVVVPKAGKLPDEPFRVTRVWFQWPMKFDPAFVSTVVIPNLAALPDVTGVIDWSGAVRPTEDEFDRLLALRAAEQWEDVELVVPLTPRTIAAVRGRPRLAHLGFDAILADDDLLRQLAEARPNLVGLSLDNLGGRPGVTEKGLAAIAGLPLIWLSLNHSPFVSRGWLRAVAKCPTLDLLTMQEAHFADDALAELTASPKLRRLHLLNADVSGTAAVHFGGIRNLEELDLRGTRFKAEEVQKLREALPRCRITWEPPKKAP